MVYTKNGYVLAELILGNMNLTKIISGIYTWVLLVIFLGIIIWAWSDKRKGEFDHLSNLPLEDEIKEKKGEVNGDE